MCWLLIASKKLLILFFSWITVGMYSTLDDCISFNKKKDYKAAASLWASWKPTRTHLQMFSMCNGHLSEMLRDDWDRELNQWRIMCTQRNWDSHSISIQMGWRRPRGSGASLRTIPWTRSLVLKLFPLLTISVKVEPTMHLASSDSGGGCQTKTAVVLGMCMRLGCGGNGV